MKKRLLAFVLFAFLVAGVFTACNSPSNISGKFKKTEYIISLDKTIDFSDELSLKGIELKDIVFESSNHEILKEESKGIFKAVGSGISYIFAKTENDIIAKAKVNIKYRFSSPKNLNIDENGLLTWDKSFTTIGDDTHFAEKYLLSYTMRGSDPLNEKEIELETNQYLFKERGIYDIKLKAINLGEIEDSLPVAKPINNGVMGEIESPTLLITEELNNQIATFSWTHKTNAKYDVYIQGIKMFADIEESNFSFNYSKFNSGEEIEILIVSKDKSAEPVKLDTISKFNLTKMKTPKINYIFDTDGKISLENNDQVSSYIMKVVDSEDNPQLITLENSQHFAEVLSEYEGGIYQIEVMAVGQNDKFFLNSNTSELITVGKIERPEVDVEFVDKMARLTFDSTAYSKTYKISYGQMSYVYNTENGFTHTIDLFGLEVGDYTFEIVALPNSASIGVEEIEFDTLKTDWVINSNPFKYQFPILDEIGQISHKLNGNVSTISFAEIENANAYSLYLNDVLVADCEFSLSDGEVSFSLENLKNISPIDDKYTFRVICNKVVDGQVCSTTVEKTKILSILSVVSKASSQTNGFFSWNAVTGDCEYYYEVYKTDGTYQIAQSQSPILTGTTSQLSTAPVLDLGFYYSIKIFTLSTNENDYLDANFVEEEDFFTANFFATRQIDKPNVAFIEDGENYKLNIRAVEFGGQYKIFVDDVLDGEIVVSQVQENYEYILDNKFAQEKTYKVSVVSTSGLIYDNVLYLDSEEQLLSVERLALAEFEVQYPKDVFGRKTAENIVFDEKVNTKAVEVKLNNQVVLNNGYVLNLMDSTFGGEFSLVVKYIAKEAESSNYYLDSLSRTIKFKRTTPPNSISYDDGMLKWEILNIEGIDYYQAVLVLVNSANSDNYQSFEIANNVKQFNLQSYINNLISENTAFASAYRQAEKLKIQLSSFGDGILGEDYILPSVNGLTAKGNDTLEILTLEKPVVSYDYDTKLISWTEEVSGSTYDIFVDGVKVVEKYESNSISLASLGSIDFLTAKRISVRAFNREYLMSSISDEISIEEIAIGNSISIAKSGTSYVASIAINTDQSYIKEVWVNGAKTNVSYTQGESIASFDFADFVGATTFEILFKAKNESQTHYYLDSNAIVFNVENLEDKALSTEYFNSDKIALYNVFDDNIRWTDFRDNLKGNSLQPIVYTVKVLNDGIEYSFTSDVCEFNLETIEEKIRSQLVEGEVKITIVASVEKDYVLQGQDNFGYYGKISSTPIITHKLPQVTIDEVNVYEEKRNSSPMLQKIFAGLEVVFENKWSAYSDVSFLFTWSINANQTKVYKFSSASISDGTLKLIDGKYHALIRVEDYNAGDLEEHFFDDVPETVFVEAVGTELINSTLVQMTVERFDCVAGLSISDDGLLTIEDSQEDASYFIELKIADKAVYKSVLASDPSHNKQVHLMTNDFFGSIDASGKYEICVIAFDENSKILPSKRVLKKEGQKLEGISDISVDDKGNLIFTLPNGDNNDLVFTARILVDWDYIKKDFIATPVDSSTVQYSIPMIEILQLFDGEIFLVEGGYLIEFTVRKEGSINANWKEFILNYKNNDNPILVRGKDLEKDYILFELDSDTATTMFSVDLIGYYEIVDETTGEKIYISQKKDYYINPAECRGYWVTDSEGENGYFSETQVSDQSLISKGYFCIDVRSLLKEIPYGYTQIKISRISKLLDEYYQHNQEAFYVYKLNKIEDSEESSDKLMIENNCLIWNWNQIDAMMPGVSPSGYYVVIEDVLWKTVNKVFVASKTLDLRNVGLKENHAYNISVIAVNFNSNIIASNQSLGVLSTKFFTPMNLDVEDGRLVFNSESFKNSSFMRDLIQYFGTLNPETKLHILAFEKPYTTPVCFVAESLKDSKLQINFTQIVEGGVTNTCYTYKVNATSLFPDLKIPFVDQRYIDDYNVSTLTDSYVNLLRKYEKFDLNGDYTPSANNLRSLINCLINSNLGIGDDFLLIDDFARDLPEGEYMVSVSQIGESNFIESDRSTALRVYVSASPEIQLGSEENEGNTSYTATVTPSMTMVNNGSYTKQYALQYKMQLRVELREGGRGVINFMIGYSSNEWHLSYNGHNVVDAISNVDYTDEMPKFKINLNVIRDFLKQEGLWQQIRLNALINVNIFAYLMDDGYVLNGKSGKFDIRFLELDLETISFRNGDFVINTGLSSAYQLRVRYKRALQEEKYYDKNFNDGKANIVFDRTGVYEYVAISIKGSYSSAIVNVASNSYVIKDLYMLSAPTLSTGNNNIQIEYDPNDMDYMDTLKFNLANDISLKEVYNGVDKGFYYQSEITSVDQVIPYVVGSKDGQGNTVYPSELMAEKFYAYLNGNSGEFSIVDQEITEGDVLLSFSEGRAILSSSMASIEAIILPYVDSVTVSYGEFYIDDRTVGINIVTDSQFNNLSANIVYEIVVSYYVKDNMVPNGSVWLKSGEKTFYSERLYASEIMSFAQMIDSSFISSDFDYFTLSVSVLGGLKVDAGTPNAVETLEGTYVLFEDPVYYGPNSYYTSASYGQQVLRSQAIVTPIITRTKAPFLQQDSNGVLNGSINFMIDDSLYTTNAGGRMRMGRQMPNLVVKQRDASQVAIDTASRIAILASYSQSGQRVTEYVRGTISFTRLSEEVLVSVTPDEDMFLTATSPITFYISIYAAGVSEEGYWAIESDPLIIDTVYKLPQLNEEYYDVLVEEGITYLDFSKYFEKVAIADDNNCYKVVVTCQLTDGSEYIEEFRNSSIVKKFRLFADARRISLQVQNDQSSVESAMKKLLYSCTTTFNVFETDNTGLNLIWNSDNMRFEWEWEDGRTDEYEYYISLLIGRKTETEIVTTNYYIPQNQGTILTSGFELRARKKSANAQELYSYSNRVLYEGDSISVNLFYSGNGSESSPYVILTEQHFINISKRNSPEKQFYFKLGANISLSVENFFVNDEETIQPIIPEFYGVLKGAGYKLSITALTYIDFEEEFNGSIVGMSAAKFNSYSSLFKSMAKGSIVENLTIDYKIDCRLNSSKVMFSPLATFNYGTIDNVKISGFEVVSLTGTGDNTVFVGGVVSVNYGLIKNCSNTATIDYTMAQQLNLKFGYGAICSYNAKETTFIGEILNCFNKNAKKVTIRYNNNLVYMAGICLSNKAKISTSGNDGDFSITTKGTGISNFTGYVAGITVMSQGGTLEYLYNNGKIEKIVSSGTLNLGGIAHQLSTGTINTLVDTAGLPIAKTSTGKPTNLGKNYATQGSGTHSYITTNALTSATIRCVTGYTLTISQDASGYKASIK